MSTPQWLKELGAVRPMSAAGEDRLVIGPWRDGFYLIEWRRIVTHGKPAGATRVDEAWYVLGVQTIDPLTREDCERILRAMR